MKARWMIGFMTVCGLSVFGVQGWAQAPEAEPSEIVMVGWILSVDAPANSFVMGVREYTIPHDKTYRLRPPRAVVVQVPSGVPIHVRWNTSEALTFNDILPGVNVVACGPNKAWGQPVQANNIALWTGMRDDMFVYAPPEPMLPEGAPPSGEETLIPLPPVTPPSTTAPKSSKPKASSGKPAKKAPARSKPRSRR